MSITIQSATAPNLKRPSMLVDGYLDEHLNQYQIPSLMNKSHFACFLSKPGGGKTSTIVGLLNTKPEKGGFKKVFHTVILVMGSNSRASIKGNFFDEKLRPENIHDELDIDTLRSIHEQIENDAAEGYKTLLILDDVQRQLKNKDVEKLLLHMNNNRRHLKLSIWLAAQNYRLMPKQLRMNITDMFVFNVSRSELDNINQEHVNYKPETWANILTHCFKEAHRFMYINSDSQRVFDGFDREVVITE